MRKNSPNRPIFVMGLGNPGPRYSGTRHNVGYRVVDLIMSEPQAVFRRRLFSSVFTAEQPAEADRKPLVFVRSAGYMNHSGSVVSYLKRRYRLLPEELLVIVDNMDLSPGQCRLKNSGGDAGHNGLKSLIGAVGGGNFKRLYVGIGRPSKDESVVEHVLGIPEPGDAEAIEEGCRKAAEAIAHLRTQNFQRVAEVVNRRES